MVGRVEGIYISTVHGAPPPPVARVEAAAGAGLRGNRHFYADGGAPPGRALTLIAAEALEAFEAETGVSLSAAESRRNVLVRRIDVNAVGGTGDVGRAVARALLDDGWDVTLAGKQSPAPPGLEQLPLLHLDRDQDGALVPANGFDLVVDVVPFEVRHAEQLLELDVGALVAISSASVYADDRGRTLDEADAPDAFPEFDGPIAETQPTVEPGEATYSTKKVAVELRLLENGRIPATIVRPCAIYGPGDRMAREWFFVKRALDRRPYVVLTMRGANLFHTTASTNIGELVRLIAAKR